MEILACLKTARISLYNLIKKRYYRESPRSPIILEKERETLLKMFLYFL